MKDVGPYGKAFRWQVIPISAHGVGTSSYQLRETHIEAPRVYGGFECEDKSLREIYPWTINRVNRLCSVQKGENGILPTITHPAKRDSLKGLGPGPSRYRDLTVYN